MSDLIPVQKILRDILPPKEVEKYMSVSRVIWAVTGVASLLMGGALSEYVPKMSKHEKSLL